jgi:formate hydrogenlyase subunit 3/multisubunit Na+/H+ antiporter MnhD subunit
MIKVGIYALIRTIAMFYSVYSTISLFMTILGIFTMLVGVFMMFFQENLKRFLAFSSVNHVGFIIMGFGLAGSINPSASSAVNNGAYLGMYGALFHLINHGIIKSLLFLCVGAIVYATGVRKIDELGGLGKKMPVTSFCFFVGSFAICGVPLLNGFMSKFTLFLAGATIPGMLWTTIIAIISSILALALYIHVAYRIFMGPMPEDIRKMDIKEVPVSMWAGMLVLSLACFVLGIFPQLIYPILDKATNVVLAIIAKGSL